MSEALSLVFVGDELESARALGAQLSLDADAGLQGGLHEQLMRARPNPDVLYAWVRRELRRLLDLADAKATMRGVHYGWPSSYALDAALRGYEATGQERFLVTARDAMLEMLKHRDDQYGRVDGHRRRVMRAWGTDHVSNDGLLRNYVTHAGRIGAPMAWYAWLVARDDTLDSSHRDAAALLLEAAGDALREFEDARIVAEDNSYAYYWQVTHGKIDALNHQTSAGEALLHLAAATGDPYWEDRARQLAGFMRRAMFHENNGTLVWKYAPTPEKPRRSRPEPIWKSQVTIRFLHHAWRLGVEFDADDLAAVAESFRRNVLLDDTINVFLGARRRPLDERARYGGAINLTPHLILGDFDEELHQQLMHIIATNPEVGGWFAHGKTAMAYAHRMRE